MHAEPQVKTFLAEKSRTCTPGCILGFRVWFGLWGLGVFDYSLFDKSKLGSGEFLYDVRFHVLLRGSGGLVSLASRVVSEAPTVKVYDLC